MPTLFLSTLPARGATLIFFSVNVLGSVISIHAPREGSDRIERQTELYWGISIHAPREGSDDIYDGDTVYVYLFLSTLPARGATPGSVFRPCWQPISIHAPREGSDHWRRSPRR